jgi:hypothetical protein
VPASTAPTISVEGCSRNHSTFANTKNIPAPLPHRAEWNAPERPGEAASIVPAMTILRTVSDKPMARFRGGSTAIPQGLILACGP